MKEIKILITFTLLFSEIGFSQISIPYGDDGIVESNPNAFVIEGRSWDSRYISYFFDVGTNDIIGNQEFENVRNAFDSWSAETNLDFYEVFNENEADIRIFWAVDNHGDPCPPNECDFDGPGGTLAHAFFPPPNLNEFAGDIHFDDGEMWRNNGLNIDVETVALHEIGHSIGLRHTDVDGSVMEAFYTGPLINLQADDIDGITSIYGDRIEPLLGNPNLCTSESYSIAEFNTLPVGSIVTWSATPNGVISLNQSNNEVEATRINDGTVTLTATIQANSGIIEFERIIEVLGETPPNPTNLEGVLESTGEITASVDLISGATAYRWYINNSFKKQTSIPYTSIFNNGEGGLLAVEGVTGCGLTSRAQTFVQQSNGGWGNSSYLVYPNPSSSQITIEHLTQPSIEKLRSYNKKGYRLYIIDQLGNVLLSMQNLDLHSGGTFDISHFKNGVYTLIISNNDKAESQQLIIAK